MTLREYRQPLINADKRVRRTHENYLDAKDAYNLKGINYDSLHISSRSHVSSVEVSAINLAEREDAYKIAVLDREILKSTMLLELYEALEESSIHEIDALYFIGYLRMTTKEAARQKDISTHSEDYLRRLIGRALKKIESYRLTHNSIATR